MGVGRSLLKMNSATGVTEKQIAAAVGQIKLMDLYARAFAQHGLNCAQVLVTKEDFRDRDHYFNMKNCLTGLLKSNVVPIVNENDVVAVSELAFTDNDELAGLVASQLNADMVVILTNVGGVFTGRPGDKNARLTSRVDSQNAAEVERSIGPGKSTFGRGGMLTKFNIARKLAKQGIAVYIANGKNKNVLADILNGKPTGTEFAPDKRMPAAKRRVANSSGLTKGTVYIDKRAEEILLSPDRIASLLPVGIIKIEGDFGKGELVEIRNARRKKVGFGAAQYGAAQAKKLIGRRGGKPFIHYNYMFIDK